MKPAFLTAGAIKMLGRMITSTMIQCQIEKLPISFPLYFLFWCWPLSKRQDAGKDDNPKPWNRSKKGKPRVETRTAYDSKKRNNDERRNGGIYQYIFHINPVIFFTLFKALERV
ncbi:hypothetical protein [Limnobacter sp.]|uniref:hypothetical protein n=1 Tax=Limnobacter sp. TaxID=2003368 RepID=UPI00311E59DA